MKRVLICLLITICSLSLIGCGKDKDPQSGQVTPGKTISIGVIGEPEGGCPYGVLLLLQLQAHVTGAGDRVEDVGLDVFKTE